MPALILVNPDALVVCKPELVEDPSIDPPPTDTGVPPGTPGDPNGGGGGGKPPTIPPILNTSCPPDTVANSQAEAIKIMEQQLAAYPSGSPKPTCVVKLASVVYNPTLKQQQECWVIQCKIPTDSTGTDPDGGDDGSGTDPDGGNDGGGIDPGGDNGGSGLDPDGQNSQWRGCPSGTVAFTESDAIIHCNISPSFVYCTPNKLGEVIYQDVATECWGICYCNHWEGLTQPEALAKYMLINPNSFGWRYKSARWGGNNCFLCWSVLACLPDAYRSQTIAFSTCRSEGNWQCETYVLNLYCWYWRIPVWVIGGQGQNWDRVNNWNKRPTPHVDIKPPTQKPPVRPINCKTKPELGQWF